MWHVLLNLQSEVWGIYPQDRTSILLASIIHMQSHFEMFGPRCHRLVCQGIVVFASFHIAGNESQTPSRTTM